MSQSKTEYIFRQFPKSFQVKYNSNWYAILSAIGEQDQIVADLIEEVRKQLFVNTASRPYIDRLASNSKVERPKFVGMEDSDFRKYIPVMSYVPKQVKLVIDQLLDLFYFKESTTSYIQSTAHAPFNLSDGWELSYNLDEFIDEYIIFKPEDFTDITSATAEEVASAINRQIKNGFALAYEDGATKRKYVRVFTGTIGAKGSVRITGGRSNISLKFDGFITESGNGTNAVWSVSRTGNTAKMTFISGDSANLQYIQEGDVVVLDMPATIPGGSKITGSFRVIDVNVSASYFTFFSEIVSTSPVSYTQNSSNQIKFFRPFKSSIYKKPRRAATWELTPGEFDVEMPSSTPIVKRKLAGSAHVNGITSDLLDIVSSTEIEIENSDPWPNSGTFCLNPTYEVVVKNDSDGSIVKNSYRSRFDFKKNIYQYTGKAGSALTGITPDLPMMSGTYEVNISSGARVSSEYTINTASPHTFEVGDWVVISGITPLSGLTVFPTGGFQVTEVISNTEFKCYSDGDDGVIDPGLGGTVRVERIGLAVEDSSIILLQSKKDTEIYGPYLWDQKAQYVLSHKKGVLGAKISAGNQSKIINIGTNDFPQNGGYVIFNNGIINQEGPVRYFYCTPDGTMYIDPSYTFNKNHLIGSSIILISRFGAHSVSSTGKEYSGYNTDASVGRAVLQELIKNIKSAGVFVNFIVRYPDQLYSAFDVYGSGEDPDVKIYNLSRGVST
jgi:hypothetical protein